MKTLKEWIKALGALALGLVAIFVVFVVFEGPRPAKAQPMIRGEAWTCSLDDIGATLTLCKQATEPGTGHRYITDIIAQSTTATAGLFLIRAGTGTNCGTGTVSVLPAAATVPRIVYAGNALIPVVFSMTTPIQVPRDKDLCVIGTATNTISIQIQGTVGP